MKLVYYPNEKSLITTPLTIYADGTPYEIIRGSLDGFGGLDATHFTNQSPNQNGSNYFYSRYEPRDLSFRFRIYADSFDDMQAKKRTISKYFTSAYGEGTLQIYTELNDYGTNPVVYSATVVPNGNPTMFSVNTSMPDTYCECTVNLTAYNPYWYNGVTNTIDFTAFTGGFTLPFDFTFNLGRGGGGQIVNNGDVPTPCTIIIYGAFTKPEIYNDSSGDKIVINKSANVGESIIIDTDPETSSVIHVDSSGNRTNIFNKVSVDSSLFQLQAGENNIRYLDSGASTQNKITFSWKDRFIGVF